MAASATGWVGANRRLLIVDCAAASFLRQAALWPRERWLDRLAGYAELARIRAMLDRGPVLPLAGCPMVEAVAGPEDPRQDEAASIGAPITLLEQLSTHLALRPDDHLVHRLLGEGRAATKRLDALWAEVDAAARRPTE